MGGVLSLLVAYLLGGLTLLPLVALALYVYISSPFGDPDPAKLVKSAIATEQPASPTPGSTAADGEAVSAKQPPSKGLPPRYGWLTVRKTFKPRAQQDKDGASAPGGGGAAGSGPADASTPSTAATYSSLLLRSVRSSSSKEPAGGSSGKDGASASQPAHSYAPPPEFFYAALKGSILYLYTSEALDECHAVLDLQQHDVTFHPVDGLLDGELFAKRNAIHLKPRKRASASSTERSTGSGQGGGDGASAEGESSTAAKRERSPASSSLLHPSAWFIFVQSNTEMEDWYLALKHASSEDPYAAPLDSLTSVFSQQDMVNLIEKLDAEPDQIPMRWLNAVFGRIFLGINRTAWLEAFIKSKLHKKLHRLALPSFLSPLMVTQVSLSAPPPTFSRPMLKDLTTGGEAAIEVFVSYPGELRVSVTTTATLSLGSRFKSYQVPLVLAVVIKEIEGDLRVRVKAPPSNRLWYGFSGEPKMTINVEPVVSATQIKWSLILKPIEKQLREVFHESVVLPNMDDIPWFDTTGLTRGGIFADAGRRDPSGSTVAPSVPGVALAPLETAVEPPETLIDSPTPSLFNGSLRKRQGTTSSVESTDTDARPGGQSIGRVETAPPNLEQQQQQPKKTWFRGGKPVAESIRSVSLKAGKDEAVLPSSASMVSVASSSDQASPDTATSDVAGRGRSGSVPTPKVEAASGPRPPPSTAPHPTSPLQPSSVEPQVGSEAEPSTSPSSSHLTAASVVSAWRNRNTDKQALTNLGLEARNAAKKWGATWTTKRKAGTEGGADDSAATTQGGHDRGSSAGSSKDLFGRLAAQLATPALAAGSGVNPPLSPPPAEVAPLTASPRLPNLTRTPSPGGKEASPTREGGALGRSSSLRATETAGIRAVPAARAPTTALSAADRDPSPASSSGSAVPGRKPSISTDERQPINQAPVRTQMSASKSMSIPSIPIARRSAEQSFSSQPVAGARSDDGGDARSVESGSSFEGRSRLGSVYRLWGSASSGGSTPAATTKDSAGPVKEFITPSAEGRSEATARPASSGADVESLPGQITPTSAISVGASMSLPPTLPVRPSPSVMSSASRGRSTSTSNATPVSISVAPSSSAPDEPTAAPPASEGGTLPSGGLVPGGVGTSGRAQETLKRIAQLDRARAGANNGPSVATPVLPSSMVTPLPAPSEERTTDAVPEDVGEGSRTPPTLPPRPTTPALPPRPTTTPGIQPPPLPARTSSSQSLQTLGSSVAIPVEASPSPPSPPAAATADDRMGADPTSAALSAQLGTAQQDAADARPDRLIATTAELGRTAPGKTASVHPEQPPASRSRSDSETRSVDGLFTYDEH